MPQPLLLQLTDIAHGGEACAKIGDRMVFVGYALPQERVRIELVEEKQRWARGRLLEVLQPSPARVTPSCPHFGPERCGGCQWQHVDRRSQIDFKRRIVRDQLQRLGHLSDPLVHPTLAAAPDWAYRSQAVFHPAGEAGLGLHRSGGAGMYPIPDCPILHPALGELYRDFNVAWDGLRSVDFATNQDGSQRLVTLRTENDQAPEIEVDVAVSIALLRQDGSVQPLIGEPWYSARIGDQEYRFSAGSRRPGHLPAQALLLETVTSYLAPRPEQVLLDVYCGYGLFTLPLAQRVAEVIGVDEDAMMMEDCAFNCRLRDNILLHEGPPADVLAYEDEMADLAVVTAPAAGITPDLALRLAQLGVRRLVHVAQNPATLARDLPALRQAGFNFREATPIDTAPHTFYVTTAALFTR